MRIDRLAWVPKDWLTDDQKKELNINYVDDYGKKVSFSLMEEENELAGVPRAYYINSLGVHPTFFDLETRGEETSLAPVQFPAFKITLREEQERACTYLLRRLEDGRFSDRYGGILKGKPGSGKTIMMLYIMQAIGQKTLLLVHKKDLFYQWIERFKMCFGDEKVGRVWGNSYNIEPNFTIGMYQTIYSRKDKLPDDFWRAFGLILLDECHRIPAATYEAVIRLFYAHYKIGCSATLRRSDGLEDLFYWHLGTILAESAEEVPTGKYYQKEWDSNILKSRAIFCGDSLARIVNTLVKIEARNDWIVMQVCKALAAGRKVLVLADRLAHVDLLKERVEHEGYTAGKYVGGMGKKKLLQSLEAQCIIGTYSMFGEATDCPTLDTCFLTTPRADIEQMVGRIQRPEEKKPLMVVDLYDTFNVSEFQAELQAKQVSVQKGFKTKNFQRAIDMWGLLYGMARKRRRMLTNMGFEKIGV